MKNAIEIQNDQGEWLPVATAKQWGDACLLADAATRHVRAARIYRAIQRQASGGYLEYQGRMPENA